MAASFKAGQFTQPTSTNSSFAVTGVGFTPKALIFFFNDLTSDTSAAAGRILHGGLATSTSNRVGLASTFTGSGSVRGHDDSKCILVANTSGTTIVAADLVSFDGDGFTLNFSTVDATARKINYIALGGTDLTNAYIRSFKPTAGTGSKSYTGVGFQPDCLLMFTVGNGNTPPNNETGADMHFLLGMGKSSSNRLVHYSSSQRGLQQSDIIVEKDSSGTTTFQADLTTMDADGFTLNFGTNSSSKWVHALCLKGGSYGIGTFNQSTSTGNQAVSGLGFSPSGVLLASFNLVTQTGLTSTARSSVGAANSSSSRWSLWTGGAVGGNLNTELDTTKILKMQAEGVSSPTVNTSADFVSLDADGFTINNGTTDATSREVVYFAFGSSEESSSSSSSSCRSSSSSSSSSSCRSSSSSSSSSSSRSSSSSSSSCRSSSSSSSRSSSSSSSCRSSSSSSSSSSRSSSSSSSSSRSSSSSSSSSSCRSSSSSSSSSCRSSSSRSSSSSSSSSIPSSSSSSSSCRSSSSSSSSSSKSSSSSSSSSSSKSSSSSSSSCRSSSSSSSSSNASVETALDSSLGDLFVLAATGNRIIANPTNAEDGHRICIRHYASGSDRTLTLSTTGAGSFRFGVTISGLTLTASGKSDYIDAQYHEIDDKWDVVNYVKGY